MCNNVAMINIAIVLVVSVIGNNYDGHKASFTGLFNKVI